MVLWQLAHAGFRRCNSRRSRIDAGASSSPRSGNAGTSGGGPGGGVPKIRFQQPAPAQDGRGSVRVGGKRQQRSVAEQAAPLLRIRQPHAPESAPVDAGDAVVPRQSFVHVRVIGAEQVQDAPVLVDGAGDEQRRLPPERLHQVLVELGIDRRFGLHVVQVAQMQPLRREVAHQGLAARIGQHAPHLAAEHRGVRQRSTLGNVEQLLVGDAAPQKERQA